MFLNKETQKLFLTQQSKFNLIDSNALKIDLILSPEFYWVRIFDIPVKSRQDALKVLPTLFEDVLPQKKSFSYYAIEMKESQYLCFAYENDRILESIKKSGLPVSSINTVFFAQTEFESFQAFTCDNMAFMYTQENILIKVPSSFIQTTHQIHEILNRHQCSAHKIKLKLYSLSFDSTLLYTLAVMCLLMIIGNGVQYWGYVQQSHQLDAQMKQTKKTLSYAF